MHALGQDEDSLEGGMRKVFEMIAVMENFSC